MAEPTKGQGTIRVHFDEIVEWRAQGVTWAEVANRLDRSSPHTVRELFRRERVRRLSPEHVVVSRWIAMHQDEITQLRARGFDWSDIVNVLPPDPPSEGKPPKLEMLIEAYSSTVSRSPSYSASTVTSQPTPVAVPPAQPTPQPSPLKPKVTPINDQSHSVNRPEPIQSAAPAPQVSVTQKTSGPFTGRMKEYNALFMEADAKRKAEDAKTQRKKEYQKNRKSVFHVKEDPYVSVAELRAEYDKWCKIHSECVSLYHEIPDDDESQADEKLERERLRDEGHDMTSGYYKLINSRASHRLTNRSKLCVLVTAALACGVYVLADTDTPTPPDAITLHGFDRPDRIAGLSEIPDPVIVRPEFTQDEIERRDAAYAADAQAGYHSAQVPASPKRLLAEALILRGVYEFRHNGWIRYDEIVELSGDDIPSASLCGHPVSRDPVTIAPPLLPDDPKKNDYPSDHQCDLAREQLQGDWL